MPETGKSPESQVFIVAPKDCQPGLYRLVSSEADGAKVFVLVPQAQESKPSILPEICGVPQSSIISRKCLLQIPEEGEAESTAQKATNSASKGQSDPVSATKGEAESTAETTKKSASTAKSTTASAAKSGANSTAATAKKSASTSKSKTASAAKGGLNLTALTTTSGKGKAKAKTTKKSASTAKSKTTSGAKGEAESTAQTAIDQAAQEQSCPISAPKSDITGSAEDLKEIIGANEKLRSQKQPGVIANEAEEIAKRVVKDEGKKPHEITPDVKLGIRLEKRDRALKCIKENNALPKEERLTNKQLADKAGCGVTLIKKIKRMLKNNPDLTIEDLIEKKRGPAPNHFLKIPFLDYIFLILAIHLVTPDIFGIGFSSWCAEAIKAFLEMYKVKVSLRYVYDFMNAMGINSKAAKRVNPMKDQDKVNAFVTLMYYAICLYSILIGARLVFADETGIQQVGSMYGYAAIGLRALATYNQSNRYTAKSYLIFLGPDGFIEIHPIDHSLDAEKFCNILKKIKKKYPDQKFIVILDNCRVHHATLVMSWLNHWKAGKNFFQFVFLPPYAPEINPVERFNRVLKDFLKKHACKKPAEVVELGNKFVENFWKEVEESPEKVIDLFHDEDCEYAIDLYERAKAMPMETLDGAKDFIESFLQDAFKNPEVLKNYVDVEGNYSVDLFEKAMVEAAASCC